MNDLEWAIKNGDLEQVREMVDEKKVDINADINGRYPLHYAADYGQTDVLGFLIEKGANVDAADKHGITPLLAAVWEGHVGCVKILLQNGASKNGTAPDGTKYLDAAENPDIQELLK